MALTREQLNRRITVAKQQGWDDAKIRRNLQVTLAKEGGIAQSAPVQQKKSPGLIAQLAPILGSVGGAVVGGVTAGPVGAFAGGAAGGAAGERYRQKASGEEANWGNVAKEGAFGALGNVGGAIKALRGAGTLAKGAKAVRGAQVAGKAARGAQVVEETTRAVRGTGKLAQAENALRSGASTMEQATRQIRLPAGIGAAQKEDAVNATMDALGFKGNATKQYRQLQPVLSQVEQRIGQAAKANPNVRVSAAEIKNSFMKNLDTQLRTGEIDMPTAQREVQKYLGDLMKKSGGANGQLDLTQLRDMKKLVNKDYQLIADKVAKGMPLTPQQKVAQVAWESIDSSLSKASPEIKDLLTQQSHLYLATPSLKAARTNPPTLRGFGSSLPVFVTDAARAGTAGALRTGANVLGKAAPALQAAGPSLGNAARAGAGSMAGNALFGSDQAQGQEAPQEMDLLDQYSMPDEGMESLDQAPQQGSQYDPNTIVQMLQQDLATTGGKNFSKIQTMAKFMQEAAGGGAGSDLNTTQATQVSQFDNSLANLDEVESLVSQMSGAFGPIKGRVNSLNPYNSTQANINQATLVAAQNIGRALEGGKLTDADILRYQKALPSINDTPKVAQDKIERLRKLITNQRQNYIQNSIGSQSDSSSLISGLNGLLGS